MSKAETRRPKARLPRGFFDRGAREVRARDAIVARIKALFELQGFEPLETPTLEYADAIGKFLPDQDRPNEGVFSFQDDDEQWLSFRYDHTAPLARYVAQNFEAIAKPYRRYQFGMLWRNDKPGPGRFREFYQIDADTIGSASPASDAEMIGLGASMLEAAGLARGDYVVRVSNRKIVDGVLERIGVLKDDDPTAAQQRLIVMRAMDKLDRLGTNGVRMLLGKGRKDDSGDYTDGANLPEAAVEDVIAFLEAGSDNWEETFSTLSRLIGQSARGAEGVEELRRIAELVAADGYDATQVRFDPSVVRGLGYYTGPVFELELTRPLTDKKGKPVNIGSLGGGGRYDDLVERFKGIQVPATGISLGLSRLIAVLELMDALPPAVEQPVLVLTLDQDKLVETQKMTSELRAAGIRAEMYLGSAGMRAQLKYADRRACPIVVIVGEDERAAGSVTLKDLYLGAEMAKGIADNKTWREDQPAQESVPRASLTAAVQAMLKRQKERGG